MLSCSLSLLSEEESSSWRVSWGEGFQKVQLGPFCSSSPSNHWVAFDWPQPLLQSSSSFVCRLPARQSLLPEVTVCSFWFSCKIPSPVFPSQSRGSFHQRKIPQNLSSVLLSVWRFQQLFTDENSLNAVPCFRGKLVLYPNYVPCLFIRPVYESNGRTFSLS